jgi:hypothetical protein
VNRRYGIVIDVRRQLSATRGLSRGLGKNLLNLYQAKSITCVDNVVAKRPTN